MVSSLQSEISITSLLNNSLIDFATSVTSLSPQGDAAKESRKTFWSLASGSHEDQIYLHIGHVDLEKGVFDLAGESK